jgi:hypothetical protein
LPVSSGSGEILKSWTRHGCNPNARQSVLFAVAQNVHDGDVQRGRMRA